MTGDRRTDRGTGPTDADPGDGTDGPRGRADGTAADGGREATPDGTPTAGVDVAGAGVDVAGAGGDARPGDRSALVREDASGYEAAAAATVGLAAVLFVAGLASLFQVVPVTDRAFGLPVGTLLGGGTATLGLATVAFGAVSRFGGVATDPDESAGLVAAAAFAAVWFVVVGLAGSQTLGLGLLGWLPVAAVAGTGALLVTALAREDVGSTAPAGALAAFAGVVFLAGIVGPEWSWTLTDLRVTFFSRVVTPAVVLVCSLLAGWASAKAYGGFGARGRGLGAHLLIYLNATAILAVLAALVLFVVSRGLPGLLQGVEVGPGVGPSTTVAAFGGSYTVVWPVSWPFVMNGAELLTEVDGVLPAIVGTVWLVVGAVVFAVPLGVGAAVFLTEYADRGRFTQVVEVATNALWSTPSIVFGLFGFAFLVPRFGGTKSLLSGMLTLGFMLLPLVLITSREAMLAVPDEYRDASAALGVGKWETVRSVVLPAALPGITTGVILGVGRIAGETAPILLTMAGGTFVPGNQTVDVLGGFRFTATPPFVSNPELLKATTALPYQLFAIVGAGLGGSSQIGNPRNFAWGTALVLLTVVLSFYAVGIATRYYFRRRLNR